MWYCVVCGVAWLLYIFFFIIIQCFVFFCDSFFFYTYIFCFLSRILVEGERSRSRRNHGGGMGKEFLELTGRGLYISKVLGLRKIPEIPEMPEIPIKKTPGFGFWGVGVSELKNINR
ncbi:hypothetical protein DFH27DRAFT_555043 [Peziza echinospora]|nr:hypothetical protein DFH27DRAFT_555043 [Peziza echinospora]